MSKILVTHKIPESGISYLKNQGYELKVLCEDGDLDSDVLIKELLGDSYDAVLTLLTVSIDSSVIDAMSESGVRVVANYAVGFDNIDIEYAKSKNIIVTNTPDVLTNAVAEFAIAMLLACSKRIVEADKFVREGKFVGWKPGLFIGKELKGMSLGILGFGRIGKRISEIAHKGFGMDIHYYDLKEDTEFAPSISAKYHSSIEDVLGVSDFISTHLPLLESTKGILDESKLMAMKDGSILINTSRGPIIKEEDLKNVLKKGKIFYAGLDVFENEPKISDGLCDLDNVVLSPHIASATLKTRSEMSLLCAENIDLVLKGSKPKTGVY